MSRLWIFVISFLDRDIICDCAGFCGDCVDLNSKYTDFVVTCNFLLLFLSFFVLFFFWLVGGVPL